MVHGWAVLMLAIARALVRDPKIVLLDEPFEGLAPIMVRDLLAICRTMAQAGQTILVVKQNISAAMSLSDRLYIINNGQIVEEMTARAARDRPEVLRRHLGFRRGVRPATVPRRGARLEPKRDPAAVGSPSRSWARARRGRTPTSR